MVAIFTGAGVGLERSSITKLGSQGILGDPVQGRSGDSVFVNAATGNLIVEKQDEFLVGLGPDVNIARTYNSLGDASDENGDNWRQSTDRRVTLTAGTAGAVGSKVVRVSGDGSRIEYTWDVVRLAYVTKEGAGAERAIQKYDEQYEVAGGSDVRLQVNETGSVTVQQFKSSTETVNPAQKIWSKDYSSALDKIVQSGSNWIWTDGNTLAVEQYSASGRLTKVTDRNGQYQAYIYDAIDANHLTQVTDDNGEWVKYNWNGNNIISVQTGYTDPGTTAPVTLTRVRYGYDTSNRLSTVTTDLTPGDESVTDNAKYVVTYTYDSTSRVKTISQSDGSLITVYYESAAPTARVTSLVQQVSPGDTRTTSFSYSLGSTAVTDSAGQVTTLTCDGNQNLTGVSMPPAEAGDLPQTVSFTYNADGTLSKITDPLGKVLTFNSYTADGQPQSITDKLGNVTTRTYGSKHELLSETTTASDNATLIGVSVSHTTRYVYDTLGNLRFEIGALGDVREYRYSTVGLLMTVVGYPERRFTVALDGVGNPIQPSEADITAWIASIKKPDGTTSDLSWTEIAKYTYDSRGEITTVMDYGIATDGGAPSTAQGYTKYTYAYDQVGRLVTKQMGVQTPTSYLYDGMGRLIATIDGTGTTNVVYNDATTTTVLTMQSGLVRTSVYNLAGDLVSETDNATSSVPNSAGALSSWSTVNLTSAATTAIDGKAAYLYTVQTTGTSGYAYSGLQAVTAGQTVTLQLTLKETASGGIERIGLYGDASGWGADDLASATILSGPGRLSQAAGGLFTVQGLSITEGTVIQVTRVVTADENIRVRAYIGSSNATTTAGDAAILAGPRLEIANEPAYLYDKLGRLRVSIDAYGNPSYALYDKAGRRTADLGADGSLVEYRYDLGDRLIATIRYANKVAGGMLASATNTNTLSNPTNTLTIADLIPTSSTDDEWAWNIYDAMDRRIESIAGDGAVTRFDYDKQGNLTRTVGYLTRLDVSAFKTTPPTTTTWPTGSWAGARNFYNKQGQLIGNTDAYGALTERVYDYAGRLIDVVAYEKLPTIAAPNTASFDEIKANILTLGGTNRHTRYVYDGQILRYVIDPLNYVTQYNYDGAAQTKFTIQYYTPLASTATDFTFDAVTAATTANSTYDRKTWLVMNSAGQLAWTIDGEGSVTGYAYNVTGAKVRETHYATARMTTSLPTSSDMDTWATGAASASSDRTTRMFYDTRGQLVFVADAEGYITRTVYDEERRVSDTYRFDTPRTGLNDASTFASMLSWVSSQTGYVRERTEYDALGRVANTYDALNVRTHYEYYATGKVLSRTQAIDTADAATTSYTYDAAGRVETMTDAEGVITTYAYDVFGNVTSQTRGLVQTGTDANGNSIYNTTDAATSAYAYDLDGRLTTQTDGYGSSTPSVAKYTYNAFGQISTKTSAYGTSDAAITRYTYDGAGRVDTRIDGDTSSVATTTRYTYTAFGQILTETAADGTADASTTGYTYDRNGQVKTRTDSYGASEASVTRYTYDALGNVASTTRADGTSDAATTSYTYFRNGWLKDVTDALGNAGVAAASTESRTESYQYDARGNRTQMTNRLGGITTFFYDKLDRVTREYSRAPDASSNVAGTYVVKASTYDSRGNRTRLVEGTSTAAAATSAVIALRTTNYQFDKLDRVVKVTRDTATALADDMVTTSTVTPTEDYTYDARGNLIRFDRYGLVNGTGLKADIATTFTYYDQLDRKTTDIQATTATSGIRSDYGYDVRGNMTSTKVYVAQVTLPTTAGGTAPAPSGSYRQTTFAYDRLDRLTDSSVISTSAGAIVSGSWNGTVYTTTSGASLVTHYDYDDRGNVIKTTDPNGNEIWSWYDDLDRKTAQLDAGGYLTRWTYDARGNVKNEQRYATRWTGAASTIAPPTVAASSADRVTDYTYDQNGNRLSEKRSNLAAWAVNSSNGVLNTGLTYSLTRYSYNALGQVLVKEFGAALSAPYADDGTAAFTYTYDSLGRLQTEAHAKYTDVSGNVVVPTTGYKYDALGNLTANTQLGATGTYTADARVTAYSYGQGGRLLSVTDAEGFVHTYSYDALGRQKKDAYNRVVNSDAGVTSSATSTVAEATGTTYDRAGRVLSQSVWTTVGTTLTRIGVTSYVYNTAGQVRQQGQGADTSGNVLYQVTNSYDSAGRLVATNAGDGIQKFFSYDRNGNQNAAITSAGADFSSVADFAAAFALVGNSNVNGTYTIYDARNQATQVVEEGRDLSATVTGQMLTTSRTYNAFGEVASETNALDATVTYIYNTMGKLTRVESPAVQITNEDGSSYWVKPAEDHYYDRAGRRIATRDANGTYTGTGTAEASARVKAADTGNLTTYVYLAGTGYMDSQGLVTDEFHSDGGHKQTLYDIMGDVRVLRDELYAYSGTSATNDTLHFTEQRFNRLGQMVEVKHNRASDVDITALNDNTRLVDTYAYDQFGQRIQHSNNQLATPVFEKSGYDALGRVTTKVDFTGNQITTSYTWDGALTVTGVQGSWTETTNYWQNAAKSSSKQAISKSDIYDREFYKVDLGGHTFGSTFDKAARILTKGDVTYTWYNTGRLATSAQNSDYGNYSYYYNSVFYKDRDTSTYGYDAIGRRLTEQFKNELINPTTGAIYQTTQYVNETAAYDALGRLTSVTESGSASAPAASIANSYDAAGNVRRTVSTHAVLDKDGAVASTTTDDFWFRYDSMNRIVVNRGVLKGAAGAAGTTIVRGWGVYYRPELSGQDIGYDAAGNRTYMLRTIQSSALYVTSYNEERENYTYDGTGRLSTVYVTSGPGDIGVWNADYTYTLPTLTPAPATGGQKTSTFGYDRMGRQTSQSDFDSSGTNAVYSRTATYDLNGQLTSDSVSTIKNDGNIYKTDTTYTYADTSGLYQLGSVYSVSASNYKNATYQNASSTVNAYQWWDGAVQGTITYKPDSSGITTFTTNFIYDSFGQLYRVSINDGRPRTVNYRTNGDGQIIRRDESDNNTANGDPHEIWYRFNGMEVGYVGNNGTSQLTATGAVADRRVVAGDGAFRNGSAAQTTFNDFAQSVDPLNTYAQGTSSGSYVVQRDGETVSSIARNVWGDASLWYEIAEANGLSGDVSLSEGQRLTLPSGVVANKHNAGTFKPYDPNESIGNVSPTTPKPPKKNNCGVFGQILLAVIAIAVTVLNPLGASLVVSSMVGSVVSQAVGLATGIQDKFNFGAVALAGIGAAVGAGIGNVGKIAGSAFLGDVATGALRSVVTQGIGVATGLQDRFSWAGVAAAGIANGVGSGIDRELHLTSLTAVGGPSLANIAGNTFSGAASAIASAITRSAIEGTSFEDNLIAGLPDVIANTIGNLVADQVAGDGRPKFDSRRADSDLNSTMASLAAEAKANSAQISAQGRADNQAMMLALAGQGATWTSGGWFSVVGGSLIGSNATSSRVGGLQLITRGSTSLLDAVNANNDLIAAVRIQSGSLSDYAGSFAMNADAARDYGGSDSLLTKMKSGVFVSIADAISIKSMNFASFSSKINADSGANLKGTTINIGGDASLYILGGIEIGLNLYYTPSTGAVGFSGKFGGGVGLGGGGGLNVNISDAPPPLGTDAQLKVVGDVGIGIVNGSAGYGFKGIRGAPGSGGENSIGVAFIDKDGFTLRNTGGGKNSFRAEAVVRGAAIATFGTELFHVPRLGN